LQAAPDFECTAELKHDVWVLHELAYVRESRVEILLVDTETTRFVTITDTANFWANGYVTPLPVAVALLNFESLGSEFCGRNT
jgi:hypothetical protein